MAGAAWAAPTDPQSAVLNSVLSVSFRQLSTDADGAKVGDIEMVLRNISRKDIAVYVVEMQTQWSGGGTTPLGLLTMNLVTSYAATTHGSTPTRYGHLGPLRAGEEMLYPTGGHSAGAGYAGLVRAVAFDDNTVVGDADLLKPVFVDNEATANDLASELPALHSIRLATLRSGLSAWQQDVAPRLRELGEAARPQQSTRKLGRAASELMKSFLAGLSRVERGSDLDLAEWFGERVSYLDDYAAVLRAHSILMEVKQ